MTENMDKWPSKHRKTEKSGHRLAAEKTLFPRRWYGGIISANLEVIWEMSAKRASSLGINVAITLVTVLTCIAITEGVLRATDFRYLMNDQTRFPSGYWRTDPELGVDHARNLSPAPFTFSGPTFDTFTNELGCFDHPYNGEKDYVLAVGDSATWGYTALEHHWTTLLEKKLNRRILKCGVSGTGPKHELIKGRHVISATGAHPKLVIALYDVWNDFNDDVVFPGYTAIDGYRVNNLKTLDLRTGVVTRLSWQELKNKYQDYLSRQQSHSVVDFVAKNFVLGALLRKAKYQFLQDGAFSSVRGLFSKNAVVQSTSKASPGPLLKSRYEFYLWNVDDQRYPWVRKAFDEHVNAVLALRRLAKDYGAKFVLIVNNLPHTGLRGELRKVLWRELPHVYDVGPFISGRAQGQPTNHRFDSHWNRRGNELAAKGIYEYLTRSSLF